MPLRWLITVAEGGLISFHCKIALSPLLCTFYSERKSLCTALTIRLEKLWSTSLRAEYPHKLLGILLHGKVVSSCFIYLFYHVFTLWWIHGYFFSALGHTPVLLITPQFSVGSYAPFIVGLFAFLVFLAQTYFLLFILLYLWVFVSQCMYYLFLKVKTTASVINIKSLVACNKRQSQKYPSFPWYPPALLHFSFPKIPCWFPVCFSSTILFFFFLLLNKCLHIVHTVLCAAFLK